MNMVLQRNVVDYGYKKRVEDLLAHAQDQLIWENLTYEQLDELIADLKAVSHEGQESVKNLINKI